MTKVYLASDHAGFATRKALGDKLAFLGYEVEDVGAHTYEAGDDYPPIIKECAKKVAADVGSFGIVLGGSGTGEAIAANKIFGIRCALFYGRSTPISEIDQEGTQGEGLYEIVKLARQHNNANMLSIGARFVTEEEALLVSKLFLETSFSGDQRHERRIELIEK